MKKYRDYFDGKIIWITGASSGIGEALTRELARCGAKLIISARSADRLGALSDELGASQVKAVVLDLADHETLPEKAAQAHACFGGIDILINNAGISQRSELHATSFSVIRRIMQVNFMGAAELTTLVIPHLYERGSGQIVTISSIMGKFGTPLRTGYCASKHAIEGFYESLAIEAGNHGVSITLIAPGWIRTDISKHALSGNGSTYGKLDPGMQQAHGPDSYVATMLRAIAKRKFEVLVALSIKTRAALLLKHLWPGLLRYMLSKVKVT